MGSLTIREVLLEREPALEALRETWTAAVAGHGRLALVAGEAGVGKTTLVRRFCEQEARSSTVLRGVCDALFTPRPLGPFLELAAGVGGEFEAAVRTAADSHDVAAALMRELRTRSPTLVVLEDVHWADESTLDVLKLVARRIDAVPALLLATYRDDELEPAHPLRHLLGQLGARTRLVVERLSPEAVAELAAPAGLDPDDLYGKTGGNPFFVTEVLAAPAEDIPASVRDAVLARCARVSINARMLLGAVAIPRPEAELWLLDALAGEGVEALEECLASGMLAARPDRVGFRHELARLTVEESLAPDRRIELHRRALAALSSPPAGTADLARLAHHADAAGDGDAVLRYAPAAGDRAAELGSHREAAAQFQRALRFADGLAPSRRAELHRRRAHECYLIDQIEEAITSAKAAVACQREVGDRAAEGRATVFLSSISWCPGLIEMADEAGHKAVEILEQLPRGHDLASAYANVADLRSDADDLEGTRDWATRALELAEELDDDELVCREAGDIARAELLHGIPEGLDGLDRQIRRARQLGSQYVEVRCLVGLAKAAARARMYGAARDAVEAGLQLVGERGYILWRLYLLAYRARIELEQGCWTEAAETAGLILQERWISTLPRTVALTVLGLVRARRGDPGSRESLEEAWALAVGTGEPERMAPVAAARAEAAWLETRREAAVEATSTAYELALERSVPRFVGELAVWRRRAGAVDPPPPDAAEPHALELAGDWARAAARWYELGCPYEAALALADGDEAALRESLGLLQELEARPAAAIVGRRLRERGVRDLPRGPRSATRENPSGLTTRELDVLEFLAEGLQNAAIAERLFLSTRTVEHHVAAIRRKLGVGTRGEAVAEARRLELLQQG
ncbi:MAG TPA: AAA family ATPase [Gaiellaceae bacterium]|nr:AAA family ATPase [Gaiellaceae bacterium]